MAPIAIPKRRKGKMVSTLQLSLTLERRNYGAIF